MRKISIIAATVLAAITLPAQAALSISFEAGGNTLPAGTTIINNFNAPAVGTVVGPNAVIHGTTSDGTGALPAFGDGTQFLSVLGGGSWTTSFGPTSVFSFVLGSLDTYNSVLLSFVGGGSQLFEGAQIKGAATPTPLTNSGDQVIPATNGRVTYTVGGGDPLISGVTFLSTGNSMEVDDLAVSAVPEPATWGLMLMGFAAVGRSMRARRRANVGLAFS